MEAATVLASVFDAPLPQRLEALLEDAVAGCGEPLLERTYLIAERRVRIRYAGRAMFEAIGRAFEHLHATFEESPELTIDVWDSATSGTQPPPLPAGESGAAYGAKYYYGDGRLHAHFQPASGALSVFDADRNHA